MSFRYFDAASPVVGAPTSVGDAVGGLTSVDATGAGFAESVFLGEGGDESEGDERRGEGEKAGAFHRYCPPCTVNIS